MKNIFGHVIAIAVFALAGGAPARANLIPSSPSPAVQIELAEADPAADDRASYTQKASAEVEESRVKIDLFSESARSRSREAWKTASENLDAAWIKTRNASARLETVDAADWDSAKISYRRASKNLAARWAKVRADLK